MCAGVGMLIRRYYVLDKQAHERETILINALNVQIKATITAYREFMQTVEPGSELSGAITEKIMKLQSVKENYVEKWVGLLEVKGRNF